ncbi:porin precursor-like protein [Prochlorococcus marinus str. MIT 9312]|uniref:Porin-like protein n=1 Tax=Prochlorococcus marinus (strain MIT 9312) TaxID=74546 RepID=Q31AA6_PROM9|nr:porin [Prochlorococcus marinus]ABB50189.1 porin precursor-like protein [Prochlorococcus marinus str. MIT 9312]
MKLFKSLLVAPATLGLLSPFSVSASEVNLSEISNYSNLESIEFANSFGNEDSNNTLLAGGEGLVDDHSHDGGFSETTSASFSVDFAIGSNDDDDAGVDTDDAVQAGYAFQIDLNTSFTGEDSLDIAIDAGNPGAGSINDLLDLNSAGDGLTVDGVTYTFPVGDKATAFFGQNTDGNKLFTQACVYGGPSDLLDDCGNVNAGITGGAVGLGGSYDFGNGFTMAAGAQTVQANVFTEEGDDQYAINAAYTADKYALSVTYGVDENAALTDENKFTALQAYYTPDGNLPSISVGYEFGDIGGAADGADEQSSFFVGLTWAEVGPGSAGIAAGHSNTNESADELYQYEAYYAYPVNDSMTITPLIYTQDAAGDLDDTTGMMVKTSFKF